MIGSKEILAEQVEWENAQEPVRLGEMIRIYLNDKKIGKNESTKSDIKGLQSVEGPRCKPRR